MIVRCDAAWSVRGDRMSPLDPIQTVVLPFGSLGLRGPVLAEHYSLCR
jgi:hypothetical protein